MPKFRIKHIEAVWERSSWIVEAEDEEEARERFRDSAVGVDLEWKEVEGAVDSMDDEIESVERVPE